MSNTTHTKDARPHVTEARPQITAVGVSALILGFILALIATWAIGGRAAASDDSLIGVDAGVGIVAGLPASDGTTPVACAPATTGASNDGTQNGTGTGGTSGTGDGSGSGTGGGGGSTPATTGNFIDLFGGAGVNGTDGALNGGLFPGISTWRNLLDAQVLTGADGLVDPVGGNRWLNGAGGVVIGGQPQGSPALITVDGGLFANLGK